MKRILLLVLVLLPFLARSQNYSWKFFDRYSDASGFTSVQFERKMMRMMSRQAAEQGDKSWPSYSMGFNISALWRSTAVTELNFWPMPSSSPLIPMPGSNW